MEMFEQGTTRRPSRRRTSVKLVNGQSRTPQTKRGRELERLALPPKVERVYYNSREIDMSKKFDDPKEQREFNRQLAVFFGKTEKPKTKAQQGRKTKGELPQIEGLNPKNKKHLLVLKYLDNRELSRGQVRKAKALIKELGVLSLTEK